MGFVGTFEPGCILAERKVSDESDSIYMFVLTIDLTKLCQRICVASRDYKLGQYFCVHKSTTCNDSLLHAIIQFTAWKSFQSLQYTSWLLFF